MYGGNANLYNMGVAELRALAELLIALAHDGDWMIPSVGSDFGKAHVAYIPNGWITGLSKIARVVDVYARRLQVQERLTTEILNALKDTLQPLGVAVVIEASHLCMMMRGVQKQNSVTTTSAFWGEFEKNETRSEFTKLISSHLH